MGWATMWMVRNKKTARELPQAPGVLKMLTEGIDRGAVGVHGYLTYLPGRPFVIRKLYSITLRFTKPTAAVT